MAQTIENIVDPNDSSLTSEMVLIPRSGRNRQRLCITAEERDESGYSGRDSREPGTRGSY